MCARVLIADDHSLVRELIANSIMSVLGYEVVSVSDMPGAHREIEENDSFDLILIDYVMPGVHGLKTIEDLIERVRGTPVAILSGVASRSIVEDALKLGIAGFVPKTLHLKSMLAAIDFMIAGEVYAPFDFLVKKDEPDPYQLSRNEKKVLDAVCKGKANKVIAREYEMSESSVKLHVRTLSRKFGAKNRTQLALLALEIDII